MKVTKSATEIVRTFGSSTSYNNSAGVLPSGTDTIQEAIDAIATGTIGSYLTTTLGGQGAVQDLGTLGATAVVDLANANKFDGTLAQACTISTIDWTTGKDCWIVVQLTQDGTGGWVATFSGVTWDGGVTPTPSTAAGTVAFYLLHSDDGGITIYGWIAGGGSSGEMVPYLIDVGETFTVPIKKQALYETAITNNGTLVVDGFLIEVS